MKKIAIITLILCASALTAHAQVATKQQWIDFVKKDAKVSALEERIGKPDVIKADQGITRYYWFNKVNVGASSPESLLVIVEPYNGVKLVCALTDGSSTATGRVWLSIWATARRSSAASTARQYRVGRQNDSGASVHKKQEKLTSWLFAGK